ncbi:ATP-dependent helicase, partial [Nocardioides sp. CER28]
MSPTPTYRLSDPAAPPAPPVLDEHQQRVVDHAGGPLLVLAGPGTGKTTTLVEAIVDRIERRGAEPDQVLALTFSRKAADQLRDRITARLGRTMSGTPCSTFHSFAYGLIRAYAPKELYEAPLRLLSAPEADVVLRELLADHPESVSWPEGLRRALGTRGFAREVQAVLSRAREKGLEGEDLRELGERERIPEFVAAGLFLDSYLTNLDSQGATDYADLIRRATIEAHAHRDEIRARYRHVFVDEYQDTDPGQVALLRALAGDGRDLVVVGDPHQSIYGFRGAEVRGILEFPTEFPQASGAPAPVVALRTTRRFGPRLLVAAQRVAGRLGLPGTIGEDAREAFLSPRAEASYEGRVLVRTFDTERAEAEHLADLLRRAHLEDGIGWDDMAVLVRSGRSTIPPLRRALGAAGVPVEVASDEVPLVRDPAVLPLLDALRAVVNLDNADPEDVDHVDDARAEALLTGPLGGLDAGDVRRLARRLRARDKELAHV